MGAIAGTAFVDTGTAVQPGCGTGLVTDVPYKLLRVESATMTGEGTPIVSTAVNRGQTTAVASEFEASTGEIIIEEGKDGDGATYEPYALVLRMADLVAPPAVSAVGSYVLTNDDTLSNGDTGVSIVDVASQDFSPYYGATGILVRVIDYAAPINNGLWPVERIYDNGGNSTIEMMAGASSGPAADPGVTVETRWGQPAVTETAVVTIQFPILMPAGEEITQVSIEQKWGNMEMDHFHASQDCTLGNLTATIAGGAYVKSSINWIGGEMTEVTKIAPSLPPVTSTAAAPVVNGAVLSGAKTMAITAAGVETVVEGEYFSVAGARGVYKFLQTLAATLGEIAAPATALFTPGAPPEGFSNSAAITILHGVVFTPERIVPTVLSKSRGDGAPETGAITHAALVTHRTKKSVLLNCGGGSYDGFTGGTFVITSNNSGNDAPLCPTRTGVIPGSLAPTATVDLQLRQDLDDRATTLTKLGKTGTKGEPFFFTFAWSFPPDGPAEKAPAVAGWLSRNAISSFWAFAAGATGAVGTGSMAIMMGESKNFSDDIAPSTQRFFFPKVAA